MPAALVALGLVCVYPYYEYSFVGYFDHHGLAASFAMLTVLFAAAAGAGWVRGDVAQPGRLAPEDRAVWDWLPDRPQAKRWMIASAVAGGAGLWISAASIVPLLIGLGLGAVLGMGVLARADASRSCWRADPTLWRVWGAAGALASLFFYALEYLPANFSWRLEVNHPLYALAWFGAGDMICRLGWLIQGRASWQGKTKLPRQIAGLVLDVVFLAAIPRMILFFGDKVFGILPNTFIVNLSQDYILEFRSFLRQMSFLTPLQIIGGISVLPLVVGPIFGMLVTRLRRPWKAVLLVVLLPLLVTLTLGMIEIRWLGFACAVSVAAVAGAALVLCRSCPDIPWNKIAVTVAAGLALLAAWVWLRGSALEMRGTDWVLLVLTIAVAAVMIVWSRGNKTVWVLAAALIWIAVLALFAGTFPTVVSSISGPATASDSVSLGSVELALASGLGNFLLYPLAVFFPALVVVGAGVAFFKWNARAGLRAGFLGTFVAFVVLALTPFPLFSFMQWNMSKWQSTITDLDLTQLVTRDVSYRLRERLGDEPGVILSGPTTTTWMMYFGGFKGVGTLYWENVDGLKAAADIYSAPTAADAYKLIQKYGITHLAIFQWDAFAMEYARLARGIRYDPNHPFNDAPKDAFVLQLITQHEIPNWLRPLPYHAPNSPRLENNFVFLFEVDPTQTVEEAQVHVAQWTASLNAPNARQNAEDRLNQLLASKPDYLLALIALAGMQHASHQDADFSKTVQGIKDNLGQADALALDDRADLVGVFAAAADDINTRAQLAQFYAQADDKGLRRVPPDSLATVLQITRAWGLASQYAKEVDAAFALLPPYYQQRCLAPISSAGQPATAQESVQKAAPGV
jgi:hypothetical protein